MAGDFFKWQTVIKIHIIIILYAKEEATMSKLSNFGKRKVSFKGSNRASPQ
jgi:hypothetical protein